MSFLNVIIFWLPLVLSDSTLIHCGLRLKQDIWGRHLDLWETSIDPLFIATNWLIEKAVDRLMDNCNNSML